MNEGVDQVRKAEFKYREDLKGSRYLWLKRKKDLPFLFEWVSWVKRSTLEPMKKVAGTIEPTGTVLSVGLSPGSPMAYSN